MLELSIASGSIIVGLLTGAIRLDYIATHRKGSK